MPDTSLERKKIYDPLLRLTHWVMAFSVVLLLITAWSHEFFEKGPYEKAVWLIHIYTGYVLTGAFTFRLIWGVLGPRHARFSDFWHPREWIALIKKPSFKLGERFGHNPAASLAYIAFYGMVFLMIGSGLALAAIEHSTGPLAAWLTDSVWYEDFFEEPHEAIAILIVAFIVLHVGAMLLHERLEKLPVAQAMISGYQYRRKKKESNGES